MLKRIAMFVAVLAVFAATSANAAGIGTLVPNMPEMVRVAQAIRAYETLKPITQHATLTAMSAMNTMSGDAIEFPAELLPDVSMYSSGYQVYLSLSGPFPPADSEVEFGHMVEVNAGVNGGGFAWVKTIPVGEQTAHDRWWFDATASNRFDVNSEIGAIIKPGVHSFRVKVSYTANDGGITLVYDFQYEVGDFVFWTMPCLQPDGRVGLDLFVKTLFPVVVGETQVDFLVDGWSAGYGTLGTSVYSTDEWPWYASVSLSSLPEYDHELFNTRRDITLNILGAEVTVSQEFFIPVEFLPVCETGGGKGKQ